MQSAQAAELAEMRAELTALAATNHALEVDMRALLPVLLWLGPIVCQSFFNGLT